MAEVSQICAEHNIDLDDDSETLASQTTRDDHLDEEEHIDLAEFIGIPKRRYTKSHSNLPSNFNQTKTVMKKHWTQVERKGGRRKTLRNSM